MYIKLELLIKEKKQKTIFLHVHVKKKFKLWKKIGRSKINSMKDRIQYVKGTSKIVNKYYRLKCVLHSFRNK